MALTRRLLERRGADPTQPWGDSTPPPPGGTADISSGVSSPEEALALIPVLTCVGILADSVSTLPIDTFDISSGVRVRTPAPAIVEQPWPELDREAWLNQVMVSLTMRGNFYGYVAARDRMLRPTAIQPLNPSQVKVSRDTDGNRVVRVGGMNIDEPDQQIVHIPNLMLPGAMEGLNPIAYCRVGLGLTRDTERYGAAFFRNSAEAGGVLEVPGELDDGETLALALAWRQAHQGLGNAHLPAVLTGGATWKQTTIAPDDAQFLLTRQFQRTEIASLFRIPPHMMGDVDKTTSWGSGIEQQEIGYVINTLRPYLVRIERAFSRQLPRNIEVKFNLKDRLRGDTGQRFAAYVMAILNGIMNLDEVRELEDLPPLPDGLGTKHFFPMNYAPIGQAPPADIPAADERHQKLMDALAAVIAPTPPATALRQFDLLLKEAA